MPIYSGEVWKGLTEKLLAIFHSRENGLQFCNYWSTIIKTWFSSSSFNILFRLRYIRFGENVTDGGMVTHLQGYIDKCSEIFTIAPLVYSVVVVVVIIPHYCFADVLTRFFSPLSRRHPSHSSCYLRRSRLHPSLSSLLLLPCLARNCL